MSLGEKVKNLRKKKGMNQKQLAETSDITQATISRIESGKVNQLKSEALKRLAYALGVVMEDLVDLNPLEVKKEEEEIDRLLDFVIRDPDFKFGTRLSANEMSIEAKRFIVEMYQKATGRKLLTNE